MAKSATFVSELTYWSFKFWKLSPAMQIPSCAFILSIQVLFASFRIYFMTLLIMCNFTFHHGCCLCVCPCGPPCLPTVGHVQPFPLILLSPASGTFLPGTSQSPTTPSPHFREIIAVYLGLSSWTAVWIISRQWFGESRVCLITSFPLSQCRAHCCPVSGNAVHILVCSYSCLWGDKSLLLHLSW
jgi:hypothetical protein